MYFRNMTNPMKSRTWLLILAVLNLIVIAVMQSFGTELRPYTIVGFEFALTPENAQQMVGIWKENGVLDSVYFVTGFDYLFMVTYSSFLWLACMRVSRGLSSRLNNVFIVLAWLQPVAAILDAIENLALFQIIEGSWEPVWPTLAAVCAAPKFGIVLLAIMSCLGGVVFNFLRKR